MQLAPEELIFKVTAVQVVPGKNSWCRTTRNSAYSNSQRTYRFQSKCQRDGHFMVFSGLSHDSITFYPKTEFCFQAVGRGVVKSNSVLGVKWESVLTLLPENRIKF